MPFFFSHILSDKANKRKLFLHTLVTQATGRTLGQDSGARVKIAFHELEGVSTPAACDFRKLHTFFCYLFFMNDNLSQVFTLLFYILFLSKTLSCCGELRRLSLLGKITVSKSLIACQLVYNLPLCQRGQQATSFWM